MDLYRNVGAATLELPCQEGVRSSPGSVEIPAGSRLILSQWAMVLGAASQGDLESAKELLAGSHCELVGSTWDLPQGDPLSGWQGPTTALPGGADPAPHPTEVRGIPAESAARGSLLPAAVSPAGSAGIRGLAGGAAAAPGPGRPGGHAAGAGRGAGAVPGAALGRAVHPRAPAQVGTPARPPPSHRHRPHCGSRDFFLQEDFGRSWPRRDPRQ